MVRNITNTHIAHGLNPSTNPSTVARIGREYSRRLITQTKGSFTLSGSTSILQGSNSEHPEPDFFDTSLSFLSSKYELEVSFAVFSLISLPVVSSHQNHSIISSQIRIIGVTIESQFSSVKSS